jgi:phage-related protein
VPPSKQQRRSRSPTPVFLVPVAGRYMVWRVPYGDGPREGPLDPARLQICLIRHIVSDMSRPAGNKQPKPLRWVGSSKEDLSAFPEDVKDRVGEALWQAQVGKKAPYAQPLRGYKGASVLEVVDDFDGDTFRAVYTVRFAEVIYVLHAFQKKSKRGIATPKHQLDLINERLRRAKEDYERWQSEKPKSG